MFLLTLRTDVAYQGANTVDVVSQYYATDYLNKYHHQRLLITGRNDISKTNSEHYSSTPIIRPYILFIPWRIGIPFNYQPIRVLVNFGHRE